MMLNLAHLTVIRSVSTLFAIILAISWGAASVALTKSDWGKLHDTSDERICERATLSAGLQAQPPMPTMADHVITGDFTADTGTNCSLTVKAEPNAVTTPVVTPKPSIGGSINAARAPPLAAPKTPIAGAKIAISGIEFASYAHDISWDAEATQSSSIATNRTPDNIFGPQTRVDGEAGVNTGVPRFDGTPTALEARLGREIADQGNDVRIRGDNVAGPDAQINGNWYDIKELTGTSPRSLQRSVGSARNNFSNDGAADLGLSRSDTRALVDARGNATWDNPAAVRAEFDRLSRNGDFNNVAEVRVITSSGVEIWTRP